MRSLVIPLVLGFLVVSASESQAQGMSVPDDPAEMSAAAEAQPQKTPMMVVHETALPAQKPVTPPDASKKQLSSKKPAAKSSNNVGADVEPSSAATPQPIVIPAASGGRHEMLSTGNPKYDQFIVESAARNGVDPNLIVAVMRQESGFNPRARSYKGASGLMQLMPATASRFGIANIYDPQQNIEGGARYLRFLLDTFNGDVNLVLAGYNAGENAVVNSGFKIPRYRETQNYVRSISARYNASGPGRLNAANKNPVAPAAAAFGAGASSRLSNNY
jgi:soluble lytic murein transglycosylase-like protein